MTTTHWVKEKKTIQKPVGEMGTQSQHKPHPWYSNQQPEGNSKLPEEQRVQTPHWAPQLLRHAFER